ncbi:MAG: flagellar biosynthesis regulator FlaF [Rhodospirillum sp.]|nr:flagellar biosynthesis regulator FlaF [Rhodospirillum sp.]MCF8490666.1 flagellar biosynthesis regulator FlaF [Rhodospirillum sp.]
MSVDGATNIQMLEDDAYALTEAAVAMSQALEKKDDIALADALDRNLQLWVAIRTLVSKDENKLPKEVKDNLIQLSHYAAQKTFEMRDGFVADTVESLINTNLQIAEGLLEGKARAEG